MSEDPGRPRREVVTGPRRDIRRVPRRPVTAEIEAGTLLGEAYLRALVRSQFRLGLATVALVVVPLAALPLLFASWAPVRDLVIGEVPLWWLLLGALVYPAIIAVGLWYVRSAERNERQFTEMVDDS
ncbi:MAG: hypothetical protein QG597_1546 [Actinomycetota bacterium]|nr:hypothetical protein [Actinomycetota bacterium]